MAKKYFLRTRNGVSVLGPMSSTQIRTLAASGQLSALDELSLDQVKWTTIDRVKGIDLRGVGPAPGEPVPPLSGRIAPPFDVETPAAIDTTKNVESENVPPPWLSSEREVAADAIATAVKQTAEKQTADEVPWAAVENVASLTVPWEADNASVEGSATAAVIPPWIADGAADSSTIVEPIWNASTGSQSSAPPSASPRVRRASVEQPGFTIRGVGLGREVIDRKTGDGRMLIRDVNLNLLPGEFIAMVGGSGAGKSTLFLALSGRVRATHGTVYYDGQDLYANFETLKSQIGYVPQRDLFHENLPVIEILLTACRLRLASDTSTAAIYTNVERVLNIVSLTEHQDSIANRLSGGQQKRVAIAIELLSRPRVLFLDEPTAPLDPKTTTQMMQLFRDLADSGITVVMITHAANSISYCDVVVYLHKGLLTFQGPVGALPKFFDVTDLGDAYTAEERQTPQDWLKQFTETPECQHFVKGRELAAFSALQSVENSESSETTSRARRLSIGEQTRILTARYVKVLTIDRFTFGILVAMAPLVAAMLCLAASFSEKYDARLPELQYLNGLYAEQNVYCFGSVLIVILLGIFSSVREIVKELPIYLHEHFVAVDIVPYLLSKMFVLLTLGAIHCALVLCVIRGFGGLKYADWPVQFAVLFLCSAVSTATGLAISALVTQADTAVTAMIAVVIPQILFCNAFIKMDGVARYFAESLVTAFIGLNTLMSKLPRLSEGARLSNPAFPIHFTLTAQRIDFRWAVPGLLSQFVVLTVFTYVMMRRKDGPMVAAKLVELLSQPIIKKKRATPAKD